MAAVGDGRSAELRRLAAAPSLVGVIARHVDDVCQLPSEDLAEWLTRLQVPPGWYVARLADSGIQPTRIAVCGQQPDGGWDGCETISLFGFSGTPPQDVVCDNSDCTLRDLDAVDVTTNVLAVPPRCELVAVRSSGYFATAGLWLWAQYSTFVAGSQAFRQGRVLQQCLFVESSRKTALDTDIARLSDTTHQAFVAAVKTR